MKPRFALDAWALLAFLQKEEPAASRVKELLELALRGDTVVFMSIINLGEVIYCIGRSKGEGQATETTDAIRRLPLTVVSVSDEAVLAAARFKMRHPISYADAFAATTAAQQGAVLLTGDPELAQLAPEIDIEELVRAA